MGIGTVFPEMVIGFAETVAHTLEAGDAKEWSAEDYQQVATACREVRAKFMSMDEMLRKALTSGVNATMFVRRAESNVARLDNILARYSAILAATDRLQTAPPAMREMIAEFDALVQIMSRHRDMLKESLSKMKSLRGPIDWEKVEEAQSAYSRGETKPFKRTAKPAGS